MRLAAVLLALTIASPVAFSVRAEAAEPTIGRQVRTWLRNQISSQEQLDSYGIALDEAAVTSNDPLVIFVHGFNSTPEANSGLLSVLRSAGLPCGVFRYPNDDALGDSAQLFSRQLAVLKEKQPSRKVAIVAHSMGGLVARAMLEDSQLDPGNVDRLIMIGPPNHGTRVTSVAYGTDLWEHWMTRDGGGPIARFRASFADGLCDAVTDLKPGSEFLTELNAHARNPHVTYSIFLGTGGLLFDSDLAWLHKTIEKSKRLPLVGGRMARLDASIYDFDEPLAGKGDGVVSIRRGALADVTDIVAMPFGHLEATGEVEGEGVKELHKAICDRLGKRVE